MCHKAIQVTCWTPTQFLKALQSDTNRYDTPDRTRTHTDAHTHTGDAQSTPRHQTHIEHTHHELSYHIHTNNKIRPQSKDTSYIANRYAQCVPQVSDPENIKLTYPTQAGHIHNNEPTHQQYMQQTT